MAKELTIDTWARKEHFHFFKNFEEPFFSVTVEVDCTEAYDYCKENQLSFFLYYLYASLKAANQITPFHYRIQGEKVMIHDTIKASPTINRPDGTFGFSYIDYYDNFSEFVLNANIEIERVRNGKGLMPAISGENVIHYTAMPWIKFTALSHARSFSFRDSCPKISFGKMTVIDNRRTMPVSIHVHHALMDGIHVSEFLERYQSLLTNGIHSSL
jgi:chloramphenicol O-acetyltransferase type A